MQNKNNEQEDFFIEEMVQDQEKRKKLNLELVGGMVRIEIGNRSYRLASPQISPYGRGLKITSHCLKKYDEEFLEVIPGTIFFIESSGKKLMAKEYVPKQVHVSFVRRTV